MIFRVIRHFSWLHDLWEVVGAHYRRRLALLVTVSFVQAAFDAIAIALLVPITALILHGGKSDVGIVGKISEWTGVTSRHTLMLMLASALFSTISVRLIIKLVVQRLKAEYAGGLRYDLSERCLKSYLTAPYTLHVSGDTAKRMSIVTRETATTARLVGDLISLGTLGLNIGSLLVLALSLDPITTLTSFTVLSGACGAGYVALTRRLAKIGKQGFVARQAQNSLTIQALWNYREAVIYRIRYDLLRDFAILGLQIKDLAVKSALLGVIPNAMAEWAFGSVMASGLFIYAISSAAVTARMPYIIGLTVVAWRILPQFVKFMSDLAQLRINVASLEAVRHALNLGSGQIDGVHNRGQAAPRPASEIAVRNVSVCYPGAQQAALSNINVDIPAGRLIGVFGPSGAGKSTFINTILGFLEPNEGGVRTDGVSIRADMDLWRSRIGFVPQDPILLNASIRRNITFGRRFEDEDARIARVLGIVHLDRFVESQPRKLDTSVGERGSLLSGGQRQRVAIARALYGDPTVLVLDEPASALDPAIAAAIDESLEALRDKATILIVTHRPATIERCDVILYFDKGQLVRSGSFRELMTNGDFARLVQAALLKEVPSPINAAPRRSLGRSKYGYLFS